MAKEHKPTETKTATWQQKFLRGRDDMSADCVNLHANGLTLSAWPSSCAAISFLPDIFALAAFGAILLAHRAAHLWPISAILAKKVSAGMKRIEAVGRCQRRPPPHRLSSSHRSPDGAGPRVLPFGNDGALLNIQRKLSV